MPQGRRVSHSFFQTNKINSPKIKTESLCNLPTSTISQPLYLKKIFHCVPATVIRKIIYELVMKVFKQHWNYATRKRNQGHPTTVSS